MLWRATRRRRSLAEAARVMLQATGAVLAEWFESDEMKAALSIWGVSGATPLEEPGAGATFAILLLPHRWGCRRPIGGMGELSAAVASLLRSHHGEVRTGRWAQEVVVEGGRAVGVRLDDGEVLRARHVVGAVDPMTLLTKLLDEDHLPDATRRELRGLSVTKGGLAFFKADIALSELPPFPGDPTGDVGGGGYLLAASSLDSVANHLRGACRGELVDDPPFYWVIPSIKDRARVPSGSTGECVYLYVPAAPYEVAGRPWDDATKEDYLDRCLAQLEPVVPGIGSKVIGRRAFSPTDFEPWIYRANVIHADMIPSQLGPWRPIPSLSGYGTPIDGRWHTAAGARPFGGVNGWSGRATARTIIRADRRRLLARRSPTPRT